MIRTTVRLPDDLLETAKERARLTGRSLTQLLEDAVRAELSHSPPSARVAERSPLYGVHRDQAVLPRTNSERAESIASHRAQIAAQIAELQIFLRAQPNRDLRSADEIIGYDAHGLPK